MTWASHFPLCTLRRFQYDGEASTKTDHDGSGARCFDQSLPVMCEGLSPALRCRVVSARGRAPELSVKEGCGASETIERGHSGDM